MLFLLEEVEYLIPPGITFGLEEKEFTRVATSRHALAKDCCDAFNRPVLRCSATAQAVKHHMWRYVLHRPIPETFHHVCFTNFGCLAG